MSSAPPPLPPAFSQPASASPSALPPAFAKPAQPQEAPSEWSRAILPDGTVVQDLPSSLDHGGGAPSPLVWRTESSKLQKKMLPKLAALVAVLFAVIAYYGAKLAGVSASTMGIAILVTFLVSFVACFFGLGYAMRKQISGEGALSVMYLPPHLANAATVGSIVSSAAAAHGRQAHGPKTLRGVQYWDLDVSVRFYLNPMFGPSRTFLSIKTGSRENADLFRRLKGTILTMVAQMQPTFAPAPPPPPPPYGAPPLPPYGVYSPPPPR
jgi:hypothetical protein